MSETFYRLHWSDCPTFSADNAWSCLWGSERSEDGTQTRCGCEGEPQDAVDCPCTVNGPNAYDSDGYHMGLADPDCATCDGFGIYATCTLCSGTGWLDCVRGYSCERDPETLVRYIREHAGDYAFDQGVVIVFEGDQYDVGFDGEPTAIPVRVLETLTWNEFLVGHVNGRVA